MNKLVPELLVADLAASLRFWCDLAGFKVKYDRPEESFSYLYLDEAELMLEQRNTKMRQWETAEMQKPLGRGINFQIAISSVDAIVERLENTAWPLFMGIEEKWYQTDEGQVGQKQFLVQDPDGYLLRFCESLGSRSST